MSELSMQYKSKPQKVDGLAAPVAKPKPAGSATNQPRGYLDIRRMNEQQINGGKLIL